ncbi:ATP-dependent DNA helicase Rep [Oceanospirillum multiglobuliferum]|uniref:ATP-dependent DNA helicase Rep n=1 Tax=Oceanospirillum multiglobuliferum TaxID=64969 RepID=A0A1T4SJN8_9GAMM|nr:DNA helicase Rep [Oceanospirillum multiglobuliferum]OPX54216.1 DNA helicase Rep [Oceanospirillum multiglobuliferum]SKA28383.1 ATP-dependent DNA helicase Rep [Oceanospirillum multiglobuliferum]
MLSRLNDRQHEAVKYIGGPLLVLAGAGSGKTSVITTKIAYLIKECGIKAAKIAAVTFTNKAAREMKERVGNLVQGKEARGLTISTFHNLGLTIIRKEHRVLGYKAGFSLFDDQDTKSLIKDLMHKDFQADAEVIGWVQHLISGWKNDLIEPEQAMGLAQDDKETLAAVVYREYDRHLQAYNAVDFDDLIRLPVRLLRDHPEVLERWQNRIHYMLVDEYQDTNISQYLLVKLLIGHRSNLTVVGDDDQSIYAWRGARPENLITLGQDFPSLKIVKLEQNYRSTELILRAANTLIANNPHVYEKTLWSEMGGGDKIRVVSCRNEDAEAERVVSEILTRRIKDNDKYKDFAVLYRGNHQARLLEIKLQAFQVPYKISGGTSFFSRHEIKDIMGYLRLLVNPEDDNAFLRVINMPRREIGPSTLEKLGNYANQRHISLFNACAELGLEQHLSEKQIDKLRRFNHWLQQTIQRCTQEDPILAIRQMIQDIDYEAWLHQNSSSPQVAEKRMGNVWILLESLRDTLTRLEEDDDSATIEDAIARLVLRDMLEQQEKEDDSDRVQLMTLHSAKGLEFPHVYIIGMEEDLLPHRNSVDEGNIEEERRLAYVGITRARKTLAMTFASQRKQFGEMLNCTPSRFLDELPEADLEWEGRETQPDEAKRARGHAALESLKKMLGG